MDSLRILIIFSMTDSTWTSSSWMRSSTSRCLMAAVSMRMVPRRSLSLARIAAFMSSVMRSLSDIDGDWSLRSFGNGPVRSAALVGAGRTGTAGATAADVARDALHVALHGGCLLAFPFLRRLLVEFAPPQLGQDSRLFAGALEAPQGGIEILVFSDANARHRYLYELPGNCPTLERGQAYEERASVMTRPAKIKATSKYIGPTWDLGRNE